MLFGLGEGEEMLFLSARLISQLGSVVKVDRCVLHILGV